MKEPYVRMRAEQTPITSPGTGTISTDVFWIPGQKLDVDDQPKYEDRNNEIRPKGPVGGYISGHDVKVGLDVRAYPDPLGLILFGWGGLVTSAAGNGTTVKDPDNVSIPAGASKHIYGGNSAETGTPVEGVGPGFKPGIIPQTLICDSADDDAAGPWWLTSGITIEEIKISGDEDAALIAEISAGALFHKNVVSDPALTPSMPSLSLLPWSTCECLMTWGLSGSAQAEEFDISLKQPYEMKPGFKVSGSKYKTVTRLTGRRNITGTIKKSDIDVDDWNALMAGTQFAVTLKFQTEMDIGATSYPYTMWIDLPACQYTGMKPGALSGGEARRETELDFGAFYDPTSLYDSGIKITLVNGTTGYNTGI